MSEIWTESISPACCCTARRSPAKNGYASSGLTRLDRKTFAPAAAARVTCVPIEQGTVQFGMIPT